MRFRQGCLICSSSLAPYSLPGPPTPPPEPLSGPNWPLQQSEKAKKKKGGCFLRRAPREGPPARPSLSSPFPGGEGGGPRIFGGPLRTPLLRPPGRGHSLHGSLPLKNTSIFLSPFFFCFFLCVFFFPEALQHTGGAMIKARAVPPCAPPHPPVALLSLSPASSGPMHYSPPASNASAFGDPRQAGSFWGCGGGGVRGRRAPSGRERRGAAHPRLFRERVRSRRPPALLSRFPDAPARKSPEVRASEWEEPGGPSGGVREEVRSGGGTGA